jgi:hypothetical protein
MDEIDPKPMQQSQGRLMSWLGTTGIVLSFIGSWLILGDVLAGFIAGLAPNNTLWHCGFLLCGLGGSLFVRACFFCENVPEAGTSARVWYWLKLALVMILATAAAPLWAALAFGFGGLLTFVFVVWIIAYKVKRLLALDSDDWNGA